MDEAVFFSLMADLHRDGDRQGPGSTERTLEALELTRLGRDGRLDVADIGCGTGASTIALATALPKARIAAFDLLPEFLEVLTARAQASECSERITPQQASMDSLPIANESIDLIWSEGAIYNMGFQAGLRAWRPLLRPGGVLAVSEITWLRPDPPETVRAHWNAEYAEMATAAEKIAILEQAGYDLLGYLVLPSADWINNYYRPIEERMAAFLARHAGCPEASEIAQMERLEVELYERYSDWFGYGFYVARRR